MPFPWKVSVNDHAKKNSRSGANVHSIANSSHTKKEISDLVRAWRQDCEAANKELDEIMKKYPCIDCTDGVTCSTTVHHCDSTMLNVGKYGASIGVSNAEAWWQCVENERCEEEEEGTTGSGDDGEDGEDEEPPQQCCECGCVDITDNDLTGTAGATCSKVVTSNGSCEATCRDYCPTVQLSGIECRMRDDWAAYGPADCAKLGNGTCP